MKTQCTNCGKEVIKRDSEIRRSKTGNVYCSRSCAASKNNSLFKKWENHPQYKTGNNFYRELKMSSIDKPVCERCGFDNLLALDVHHIDENRKNNRIENLEILCCNCHAIHHRSKNE